jgi:SAM-dependent methyltransferase
MNQHAATSSQLLNDADAFGPRFMRVAQRLGRYDTTLDDAAHAMKLLRLAPGVRVLDAACGFGRFAGALHALGCEAVGVDVSPSAIAEARERHPGPRYVVGDLTQPLGLGPFDAIVNVFSSFGYCETLEDERRILRNWHADLRPGGRLLMEISDLERARARLPLDGSTIVRDGEDGVKEHLRVDWETGMLHCRYVLRDDELYIVMRVYERDELERMLAEAGFREIEAFGGFDGHPKRPDDRLVLVASK